MIRQLNMCERHLFMPALEERQIRGVCVCSIVYLCHAIKVAYGACSLVWFFVVLNQTGALSSKIDLFSILHIV